MTPEAPALDIERLSRLVREAVGHYAGISEAPAEAIALHLLVAAGAAMGPRPFVEIGGERHGTALQLLVVGDSASSRKTAAWEAAVSMLPLGTPERPVATALRVVRTHLPRDTVTILRRNTKAPSATPTLIHTGYASLTLKALTRRGTPIGPALAQAWRHGPNQASWIGHTYPAAAADALRSETYRQATGGHILYAHVARRELIPRPESPHWAPWRRVAYSRTAWGIQEAIRVGRERDRVSVSPTAAAEWDNQTRATAHGALHGRLALTCALIDQAPTIEPRHIDAALAIIDLHTTSMHQLLVAAS